jgi:hypothetical protein
MDHVTKLTCFGVATAILIAAPGRAHHSATMFDHMKTITLDGVVKAFLCTNPHSSLLVDVRSADGHVTTWRFEAEGASSLLLMQVAPADFPAGTNMTVSGHPMKDGRPVAWWVKAVRADGKEFYPRGRAAAQTTYSINTLGPADPTCTLG